VGVWAGEARPNTHTFTLNCVTSKYIVIQAGGTIGTWGTTIFSDDLASDIRRRYRDLVGDGLTGPQATDILLEEYREILDDPDAASVFWLALAATQWRCGRLEPRIQAQAIEAIDSGSDLLRWQEAPQLLFKRQAVLSKLRVALLSPQPPQKKIRKRFRNTCEWEIGEIIGYRLRSGSLVMFRVIDYYVDLGGTSPIFEVLDWIGYDIPAQEVLESAGVKIDRRGETQLAVGRVSERELPRERVLRIGMKLNPAQVMKYPLPMTLWRWLDRELEAGFGLH